MRSTQRTRWINGSLLVAVLACDGDARPQRRILTEHWDTVGQIGGVDANDTTLVHPYRLVRWGSVLVTLDFSSQNLRGFSSSGELLWSFGRPGHGPGELFSLASAAVGPDSMLWILDYGNRKLITLDQHGSMRSEVTLDLPSMPDQLSATRDEIIFTTQMANPALLLSSPDLATIATYPSPWPGVADSLNLTTHISSSRDGRWVIAYEYGPGFVVGEPDNWSHYAYIDSIPFARKVNARLRTTGRYVAQYGAVSIDVADDEVFMLFGGRPHRYDHGPLPTVLVDVYRLDGRYLRSYRLPFHSDAMKTDGKTFFFLTETDEGLPTILALQPKRRG